MKYSIILKDFFLKANSKILIFGFSIIIILFSVTYYSILENLNIYVDLDNYRYYETNIGLFFFILIFAPIVETFLFQFLFFYFLKKFKFIYIIFFSAIIFSLSHLHKNNSYYEVFDLFFSGIIFSTAYTIFLKRKENAFVNTCSIHAICNLISIIALFIYNHFNHI